MKTRCRWLVLLGLVAGLLLPPAAIPAAQHATPVDSSGTLRVVAQ